jgi:hypothetical protein
MLIIGKMDEKNPEICGRKNCVDVSGGELKRIEKRIY